MTYRHATNLRVPFERVDLGLLAALRDYRIGPPVEGKQKTALSLSDLKARGIVGLYLTEDAFRDPLFRKLTGWSDPRKILGQELTDGP